MELMDLLRKEADTKRYIDIGAGVAESIGFSREELAAAVTELEKEGYEAYWIQIHQIGTEKAVGVKVLVSPFYKKES